MICSISLEKKAVNEANMKEWIDIWLESPEGKRTLKICLIILGILFLILLLNWGIDLIFGE